MVFLVTESPPRLLTLMRGSGAYDLAKRIAVAQGMLMQRGDAMGKSITLPPRRIGGARAVGLAPLRLAALGRCRRTVNDIARSSLGRVGELEGVGHGTPSCCMVHATGLG